MSTNAKVDIKMCEARIKNTFYETLNDALEASVKEDIIYLLKDCIYTKKQLVIKDNIKLYIPKGMKLNVGTTLSEGEILHEAALYTETDDCTYYGSFTDALNAAGNSKVEIYTHGRNIDTNPNELVMVGENTTLKINRPTELLVQGTMTVLGTVIVTTTDCVLHVIGTLNIEGIVKVMQVGDYGGLLIASGDINISRTGKLLPFGGLIGGYNINAAVMHIGKKETFKVLLGYYARLNDALEDVKSNSIITLLQEAHGFDSLNVPADVELIVPTGTILALDIDASLNVEGILTVEDACAIVGDTMCSLWFGENAVLSGTGLSQQSNFYNEQEHSLAETGTNYHWINISESAEGWSKV